MTVRYRDAARDDLIRQFRYYLVAVEAPATALRFRQAVRLTIEVLRRHPRIGRLCELRNPALAELRWWPVTGFAFMRIYYLPGEDELKVLRILHSKRDVERLLEVVGS